MASLRPRVSWSFGATLATVAAAAVAASSVSAAGSDRATGQTPELAVTVADVQRPAVIGYFSGRPPDRFLRDKKFGIEAGEEWLGVGVTLQRTGPLNLKVKDIVLRDASAAYPLVAIGHKANRTDGVIYCFVDRPQDTLTPQELKSTRRPASPGPRPAGTWTALFLDTGAKIIRPTGAAYFASRQAGPNNRSPLLALDAPEGADVTLSVSEAAQLVTMLFAVPAGAVDLRLAFGTAEPMPITTTQK